MGWMLRRPCHDTKLLGLTSFVCCWSCSAHAAAASVHDRAEECA